jgi:thiol:disulfide interchange protein DsbD
LLLLAIAGWFLGRWPAKHWTTVVASLIVLAVVVVSVAATKELAETPSNSPVQPESSAARSVVWQTWSADAVEHALAAGRPVFVDFTAKWCLSCQFNERVALDKPEVVQAFQAKNVVLMKADWTRQDSAITEELTTLGRSGVPVYALYTPGAYRPELLPQVLTPGIVMDALGRLSAPATQAGADSSK